MSRTLVAAGADGQPPTPQRDLSDRVPDDLKGKVLELRGRNKGEEHAVPGGANGRLVMALGLAEAFDVPAEAVT